MKQFMRWSILVLVTLYSCKNSSQVVENRKPNQLINESSPYLLQHAYNPVDWHPWGEEAFAKAEKEGKLLIVSVGYAACHWCHVMEHESFEDSTVAAMMNEHFLPIKVDREERPDVDDIYMSAAQLISGSGGWPLNAFAMPDGRPVWAGTYFPKDRWMDILKQFADLNKNDKERLERSAEQLTAGIQSLDEIVVTPPSEYTQEDVTQVASLFLNQVDMKEGGRRGAPKFPMPNNYEFLLKYATLYDDTRAMKAVTTTLDKMANGGIYDQAGGGFSRYSVDSVWLVPHFEKMLYDNGQLVGLYSKAYRQMKDPMYARIIRQTLKFIERELMSEEGGFYSSLDADSEGEEGKFYVWGEKEVDELIADPIENALVKAHYNIQPAGNWEHGNNILHVSRPLAEIAKAQGVSIGDAEGIIDRANTTILEARASRVRPGLDDKVLTSWNALMISGYVEAYKALGDPAYLETAVHSAHFILNRQMSEDGRLDRNYKDGKSSINGFLDDYALLIEALMGVYEITFDESWANVAKDLADYAIAHFYDEKSKMFFYTSEIDPPLIARKMELPDNVIPASNSTMARVLNRLGELYYNKEYSEISDQMMANMWTTIKEIGQPSFYSNWIQLLLEQVHPSYEVAIVGSDATLRAHEMMKTYHPNVVYIGSPIDSPLPLLESKYVDGETMIYVCQNKACKLPVKEVDKALELIK